MLVHVGELQCRAGEHTAASTTPPSHQHGAAYQGYDMRPALLIVMTIAHQISRKHLVDACDSLVQTHYTPPGRD